MYDIIVFENLHFRSPRRINEWPAFSKIFTLESVFEKMRFGHCFHGIRVDGRPDRGLKQSPFSNKNGHV